MSKLGSELGNLLILAMMRQIERQKKASDSLAILAESELSEASTDQPITANRRAKSITSPGIQQVEAQ